MKTTDIPASRARSPRFLASVVFPVPAGPRKRTFRLLRTKSSEESSS